MACSQDFGWHPLLQTFIQSWQKRILAGLYEIIMEGQQIQQTVVSFFMVLTQPILKFDDMRSTLYGEPQACGVLNA
jgi:hypothetical protein